MQNNYSKAYLSEVIRENIKKYRIQNNMTQQTLADLTDLSHGYVRDLECVSRNKTPRIETLGKIANALNVEVKQLFEEKKKI